MTMQNIINFFWNKNASDKYSYLVLEQGGLDVDLGIYDGFNPGEEPCIHCWEINTAVDEKAICDELHDLCFTISACELVARRLYWIRQDIRSEHKKPSTQEWVQKYLQKSHQELCDAIAQSGISTDELPMFTFENHDALEAYEGMMHEKLLVELRKTQPIVNRYNEIASRLGILQHVYYYVRYAYGSYYFKRRSSRKTNCVRDAYESIKDAYILRKRLHASRLSRFSHC